MLLDILFPKSCLSCKKVGSYICLSCQKKLIPLSYQYCLYCEKPSPYGITHPSCITPLGVDAHCAIYAYTPTLKKIITQIKYRLVRDAIKEVFYTIKPSQFFNLRHFDREFGSFSIQPIPLHEKRLRTRGFNQAEILAGHIATVTTRPLLRALQRQKNTFAQAKLDKVGRQANIRGAFAVLDNAIVKGKNILLVDDVVTTGSTVKEAASTLKQAGASKVVVFSLAKD